MSAAALHGAAFVAIFMVVSAAVNLLGLACDQLFGRGVLRVPSRVGGALFGLGKGAAVFAFVLLFLHLFPVVPGIDQQISGLARRRARWSRRPAPHCAPAGATGRSRTGPPEHPMARRIPDETLQAIRDRISIVEVISAYVSLKRAGRNYVGLCPFHGEKTPSFTVSDERGLYHCFGCGESGTVFTFVMKIERLEFLDAVAQLAKRAGVALPRARRRRPGGAPPRAALRRERAWPSASFARRWPARRAATARRYLAGRGLSRETITRYGLGLAPAGGTVLASHLATQRVPVELALQAGLLGRSDGGRVYDRFRGRVMFPIRDRRGRTIAFGGRTLGDEQPKYLNSPETPLFRKGEGVYGVAEARDAIRSADRVVLVEGYMDALVLVQEGIPYTVATLGTALTAAQLRLLRPLGGEQLAMYVFFDGDRAGRQAALRAFAVCAEAGRVGPRRVLAGRLRSGQLHAPARRRRRRWRCSTRRRR